MKEQPKITVIIPVYNAENFLVKCLDSVIYQTYENLEIICINDGSTDKSEDILRAYKQKDKRIIVINQENKGQGAARNTGLAHSSGDYVSFVDSDDWLLLTLYENFVNIQKKLPSPPDVFMFNASQYFKGKNDVIPLKFFETTDWQAHENEYTVHTFFECLRPFSRNMSANNKIYKKSFLNEKNIRFLAGSRLEDVLFYAQSMLNAKSIVFTPDIYYRYRNYAGQTVALAVSPNVFDVFNVTDMIQKEVEKLNRYREYKYALFQLKYTHFFNNYKYCPDELKEEYFNKAKEILKKSKDNDLEEYVCLQLRDYPIYGLFIKLTFEQFDKMFTRK